MSGGGVVLNFAGPQFDFAQVVFAVLQELEHRRRSLNKDDLPNELRSVAAAKLAQVRATYVEAGGSKDYWQALEKEVLDVAVPRFAELAHKQTAQEKDDYGVWRGGDLLARAAFGLAGITLGGIIIEIPFIPIFEAAFAFALAGGGLFYPDLRRLWVESSHTREMNRIVREAARYQADRRIHYISSDEVERALTPADDSQGRSISAGGEKPSATVVDIEKRRAQ